MNPIAIRLLAQQLASPQFASPHDIVSHFGAMQAQDYRMMRWAVVMRMRRPSAEAFCKAFYDGEIIRLHLLRGTWQLVSCDDYPWMLRLFAGKAERTIRGWMKANRVTIDDEELHSIRHILAEECMAKGNATKEDFAAALMRHGINMDAHRLSYHIRLAEISGALCSGCLTPMRATYALAENKVKTTTQMEKDEMLALLARKYFQSHSPATFDDYLWWSGLTVAECLRGMDALGAELSKDSWKGYEFYIHESCRRRGFRKGKSLLLPPFDEYLIGYKSREIVLHPTHVHHAHTNNGIFFPIIARDGVICGNWSPWEKELETSLFMPIEEDLALGEQWKYFSRTKGFL